MTDGAFLPVFFGILAAGLVITWLVTKLLRDRLDDITDQLRAMTETADPPNAEHRT